MENTKQLPAFVQVLISRQQSLGMTSEEFARLIGVTPAYWSLIRSGKRRLGVKLIDGALDAFDDLSYPCARDLPIVIEQSA